MENEIVVTPENPFAGWSETKPEVEIKEEVKVEEPVIKEEIKTETVEVKIDEQIVEPFYKKLGLEKEEDVINEISTLREKTSKGYEYKNDDSKRIAEYINEGKEDDLYKFLDTKKKVEKLATADLSDKDIAAELVKFGLQRDNPTLNDDEVDFLFNEKYTLPKKPIQDENDTDDEYSEKVKVWQNQVATIEKRMVIEAKIAQPKMAQYKTELVLPDIQRESNGSQQALTQEELQKRDGIRNKFLSKLESDYKNFNGYEIKYKDEEVEIPVTFAIADEDKIALKKELEDFDVDGFIGNRWFNQDGSPNVVQMMDDVTLLRNKEKAFQKIANEVGAQMKLHYMGKKANVNVTGAQEVVKLEGDKTQREKEIEFIWKQR